MQNFAVEYYFCLKQRKGAKLGMQIGVSIGGPEEVIPGCREFGCYQT